MEAMYFDGDSGERIRKEPIPDEFRDEADRARHGMLDTVSLYDDELMEALLEDENVALDLIHAALRRATLSITSTLRPRILKPSSPVS